MAFFGDIQDIYKMNGNNPFSFYAQNPITNPEMLNFNVPLVQKQYAAPTQSLTPEGAVPIGGASSGTVDNTKGTTVEITSDTKKVEEAKQAEEIKKVEEAKKAEEVKKAQQARKAEQAKIDEEKRATMADKRDINTVMKLSRPGVDWDKLSMEEKQKEIMNFLETTPEKDFKYIGGRAGWIKTFLTNNRNMDSEETKMLVGSFKYTKDGKLQVSAINMTADEKVVNKYTAQIQVVEDSDKYCVEGQKASIDVTTASEYDDVKIGISKKISNLDESLHLYGVQKSLEGSKTSSEDVQKQIGFNLVDQYGKYAKSAQAEIHKTISGSNLPAVTDYAKANVSKLNSTNNTSNPPVTVVTTNVTDKPVVSETTTATPASNSSQKVVSVSEPKTAVTKVNDLLGSNKTGVELATAVKNLSDIEKIALIRQNSGNLDLIRAIFTNNPSTVVLAEISKVIKNNQEISKAMSNSVSMLANVGFLGIEAQFAFVDNVKNLNAVDIKMLCPTAQARYNARLQEGIRVTNKG